MQVPAAQTPYWGHMKQAPDLGDYQPLHRESSMDHVPLGARGRAMGMKSSWGDAQGGIRKRLSHIREEREFY